MIGWAVRRLVQSLLVVLLMTLVVFIGLNAIGNPMDILVGEDLNQAERLAAIAHLGLDKPLWQQYLLFLKGAASGNLGQSFVYHEDAMRLILQRLPATFELAFSALFLAVLLGVPLGMFAGTYPDHPVSRVMMATSIVGFSLPAFWVALMMIMLFSIHLGWLPASGRGETREFLGVQWSFLTLDGLQHLILPALNLALFKISLVLRLTRAGVREVLPQEFVKFARAKGLSPMRGNVHARDAQHHDPAGDGAGNGVGVDHRLCRGDRKYLCLAGCRKADPGQHQYAGSPGCRGLSDGGGRDLRGAQSDRRCVVLPA